MDELNIANNQFQAGDIVRIKDSWVEWSGSTSRETIILGVMNATHVFVSKPDGGYPRTHKGCEYFNTWNVPIAFLELISRPSNKVVSVYTTTCKHCRHPARTIRKSLFCSNTKCKSRHRFKKSFPVPYCRLPKDVDTDNFIICHQCKERINYLTSDKASYIVKCKNNHERMHILLDEQKITYYEPGPTNKTLCYVYRNGTFHNLLS